MVGNVTTSKNLLIKCCNWSCNIRSVKFKNPLTGMRGGRMIYINSENEKKIFETSSVVTGERKMEFGFLDLRKSEK